MYALNTLREKSPNNFKLQYYKKKIAKKIFLTIRITPNCESKQINNTNQNKEVSNSTFNNNNNKTYSKIIKLSINQTSYLDE